MSVLDTIDSVAESVAIGFALFLVGIMAACALAMVGLMWSYFTNEFGLIAGALVWVIAVGVSFSVSWTGVARNR